MSRKVAIVGSRKWASPEAARHAEQLVQSFMMRQFSTWDVEFVSGGCPVPECPDAVCARWCEGHSYRLTEFPGEPGTYLKRNTEIVKYSDAVFAVWNGKSRGTKDVIDKALRMRKDVTVVFA